MSQKIINTDDLAFLLYELLDVERFTEFPRYADHSRDTFDAAIELALKVGAETFAPHSHLCDGDEPRFENGKVVIRPEVSEALAVLRDTGLMAASQDYERGGMQLPSVIAQTCIGLIKGANVSTQAYAGLTIAACNLIMAHGSEEYKQRFAEPMMAGRFFGTMCLTEPQAGSSLADIKTRAVPAGDGSYRITGNKIFISAGDHELSENIVHLVLAKLPDAPPGVKGISLFIVPKFMVNEDGSLGGRNDVTLAGLIHKMGYRGTTSTMLNFGEQGGAVGYLVGEPHQGLAQMFHMMNEARIGVGLGSAMLGYTGYLHALEYARERRQGRPLKERDPQSPMIPLIQHADIRRMLLAQKSFVEGGLALCLYAATLSDQKKYAEDQQVREESAGLLDLLIPIVKSWPSQFCVEANSLAIQVHGGYGYTREYPVEQFYRDNRLNPIHEGTHGIQGQDLLGRKVAMQDGRFYRALVQNISNTLSECAGHAQLESSRALLAEALDTLQAVTESLQALRREDPERALANAYLYMECFGHVVVGWIWLRQAQTALRGLEQGGPRTAAFYEGKLRACEYFLRYELPKPLALAKVLGAADRTTLDMPEGCF
ncbi:acyl-CoA dehydrogenase [Halopseudomonas bauzanensis]|uniref:3-methylmercaptopropionyl-CoA dehydrogenase n=1 Tax=Halopseudomonas bauzanensis TaxID=653930 RepID=A0A4U0YMF8_9GAMM|nr:acyl-CoA dehydrogenase [Halopseudomonas bauzanensis]TKA92528.1 acyl-CoA dehydrogenase [Halopseudomonas bauzanensis]